MEFACVVTDKQYSEAIFMAKKKKGQNLAQNSRKWHKKYQIGESSGERKTNPSATPALPPRVSFVMTIVPVNLI